MIDRGCELKVILDSITMAEVLIQDAAAHSCVYKVLLEIDCDGHRAGLSPDDPRLVAIASRLRAAGQEVVGVLTHAGSAYNVPDRAALKALALREADAAGRAARLLRGEGHACPVVSVGSTPSALLGEPADIVAAGVTEVRCGVYMFMDLVMHGLGVCDIDDIALSVLTSVIGGFPEDGRLPGRILLDAGWAALSGDRGLQARFEERRFGLVRDIEGNLPDAP